MMERTLVVIKPDGVRRGLEKDILSRYEQAGMKIIAKKSLTVHRELAESHYTASHEQILGMGQKTLNASKEHDKLEEMIKLFGTDDPKEIGTMLREFMLSFITSGPVHAVVLEGEDAVKRVRAITGFTDPARAEKGTVRGDFGQDNILKANSEKRAVENLVHASGSLEEANFEINLWFKPEELGK